MLLSLKTEPKARKTKQNENLEQDGLNIILIAIGCKKITLEQD